MAYNYYNNNLEKRIFAFKPSDDGNTWKLNESLLNHINPGQAMNQRQSPPFLVEGAISIDSWWNDRACFEFNYQQKSTSTRSNPSVYSDNSSNNADQEHSRKFTYVPPGLFPPSSSHGRLPLHQDTTNTRSDTHLPSYNQKKQQGSYSRRVSPRQDTNFYSFAKTADNHNKENEHFYDELKPPTWSEVIARDKSSQSYKVKPPINSHIIRQLFKNEEKNVLEDRDADTDATNGSTVQTLKNMNSPKYITESVYLMSSINNNDDFNNTSIERPYTVVRVGNIPWGLNIDSIKRIFQTCKFTRLPTESELPQAVHILMDVKTGKTTGVAFVEAKFLQHSRKEDLTYIISSLKLLCTQSRRVTFELSSYDQLCNELFPSWKGEFKNGKAIPSASQENDTTMNKSPSFFMDQKDLQSLLNICRHYKVHYNRRCPERPFEYLIAVIMNIPWKQAKTITTIQRDIIYECYKLVTEALKIHTSKPMHSFDTNLLERLVRAAILCDGFTIKQKSVILKNANLECPEDLQIYLQEPPLVNDRELASFFD